MNKKIYTTVLTLCFFASFITINSNTPGKLKGKVVSPGDNGLKISLNANGGSSSSSGVSNAFSFNPNLGLEYFWGNFGLGLDAGTFSTKSDFDFNAYSAPLKGIDFLTVSGSNSSWRSTSVAFGPSYTFKIVKRIPSIGVVVKHNRPYAAITVSVKGGVTFNEVPDFSIVNNSTQKKIASYSASTDYQKNALTIKPSVVFSYWLSENVAVSANVQYAMQTGQTAFTTGYKDLRGINISAPISPDQFNKNISTAPNITTTTVGPDKYLSFGVGLTYSFGRKGWDGTVKGGRKGRTYTGGRKNEEKGINENGLTTNETVKTSDEEKRVIWGLGGNADNNKINTTNNSMPNRISMNLTVGKQTQGATFGEKVNAGKINVTLVDGGCIVLFTDNGFRINTKEKTIEQLSQNEYADFGEKVQQGLHAAGGALASGASLLGGALPGGAIISAAVSSVGNLAGGAGGGAAAASYAKTSNNKKKKVWDSRKDDNCDGLKTLPDGEYELEFVIEEKTSTKSKKEQTQVIIAFSSISNVLKTKHDTAKNSVGNIR